jgi:hypothetical protein
MHVRARAHSDTCSGKNEVAADLLKLPAIFRFGDASQVHDGVVASGFAALDHPLVGGWPLARLTELLCDRAGVGELSLLLPTLPKLTALQSLSISQTQSNKKPSTKSSNASTGNRRALLISQVALPIGAPCVAYAPALERAGVDLKQLAFVTTASAQQTLWAMEQALLSGAARYVLGWIREHPHDFALRRISLAAKKSDALCFLMRPTSAARSATPAELRLLIRPASRNEIDVTVLKRRGLLRETTVRLDTRALPCLAPDRAPIVLPAPLVALENAQRRSASLLQSSLHGASSAPAKIRERSLIVER